ncbi:Indoleamine 2,3-dioxygenase [Amylocystis lapponica]|nr:Indoleamine 2,3-dioxygenase [Amylocystis lapponica]
MFVNSPIDILNWLSRVTDATTVSNLCGVKTRLSEAINFDVDPETGFFPPRPLARLPIQYEVWERALEDARGVLTLGEDRREESLAKRPKGESWRSNVRSWPVISTAALHDDLRLLQRAHYVLASIMHFYVHSIPPDGVELPTLIPKSISIPLVDVSETLGMAPVLTFADTVLWNWELINPELPLEITNMRYVNIFSGTKTEENFYLTSAAVELKGVEMLKIFEAFLSLPDISDAYSIVTLSKDLSRLANIIDDLTAIFQTIRDAVDPEVFYWSCRPWWSGSTSKGPSSAGWIFEGIPDSSKLDLGGASAGQSSVMHALDIFLDIDHKLQEKRHPAPSAANQTSDRGFMERMRRYMPAPHQEYLRRLASAPRSVRSVAKDTPAIRGPFDAAVMALKKLRDLHIRIVCLYVVTKTDSVPPPGLGPVTSPSGVQKDGPARGTGGSHVSTLLKAGRDATLRTMLKDNC